MTNFKNVYKLAASMKVGDKYRMTGGSVLIVDDISVTENAIKIAYHSFDFTKDGSKTNGAHSLPIDAKVREPAYSEVGFAGYETDEFGEVLATFTGVVF